MSAADEAWWFCNPEDQGGSGRDAHVSVVAKVGIWDQEIARIRCYDDQLDRLPYRVTARLITAAPLMRDALRRILENGNLDPLSRSIAAEALQQADGPDQS